MKGCVDFLLEVVEAGSGFIRGPEVMTKMGLDQTFLADEELTRLAVELGFLLGVGGTRSALEWPLPLGLVEFDTLLQVSIYRQLINLPNLV